MDRGHTEREELADARRRVAHESEPVGGLTPTVAGLLSLQRAAGNNAATDMLMRTGMARWAALDDQARPRPPAAASLVDGEQSPTLPHESDQFLARELKQVAERRQSVAAELRPTVSHGPGFAGRIAARFGAPTMAGGTSAASPVVGSPPVETEKVRIGTAPDGAIPRKVHAIWPGGSLRTDQEHEAFRADLAAMAANYPAWEFVLWTDVSQALEEPAQAPPAGAGPGSDDESLLQWGAAARIRIANANDISPAAKGEFGDQLRVDILNRFGGVYMDSDSVSEGGLPATLQQIADASDSGSPSRGQGGTSGARPNRRLAPLSP